MTRTSVDLVTDVGLVGGQLTGTVDVTAALFDPTRSSGSAEDLCRQYGVKKVTMPSNCKLLISKQKATWFPSLAQPIAKPVYARDWLGDPGTWGNDDGTRLILDIVPTQYVTGSAILTVFEWDNTVNGSLAFRIDAQAGAQMGAYNQQDYLNGTLVGFAVNGIRAVGNINPDVAVSFLNHRSRNPSGYGSAFCCEMIQGQGGHFWTEFDVQDGSFGSECIVFHGYTFSGSVKWYLDHVRSRRMWRGWGCFNGGQGEVRDVQCWDLHPPGGTTSNIEAGNDVNGQAGGTPGPILLYAPQSDKGGIYLNINNNYGNTVGNVQLIGGTSTKDDTCITLTGQMGSSAGAPRDGSAVGLYCSDAFFDTPKAEILHLQSGAVATDVRMARCKFNPAGAKKVSSGSVPSAWDLTFGTGTNVASTLSKIAPADGSTVTAGGSVTVSCDASDDHDSPGSGLTADGQAYLPAVSVTKITVSGTTATLVASAAHGATNGGKVRVKTSGVPALNGTWTVTSVSTTTVTNDTLTYTVPSGTSSANPANASATVEPVGAHIPMTAVGTTGFTGTWTAPASTGVSRRIEITVTDSGPLSTIIASTVTTTTNNPPLATIVGPTGNGQINAATGQALAVVVIDPNVGDTISAATFTVKDSLGTTQASGNLTSQTPAVSTTLAAAIADVTQLNGDATDIVTLTSMAGASAPGVLAVVHGLTSIVTISYTGVNGNTLTGCTTIAGTGALASGDTVRSANYTATFDASAFTPGATYTAQATATDNHAAPGASAGFAFTINTPPTVTWGLPRAGRTLAGTVTLVVTVTDDAGTTSCHGGLYNNDTGTPVLIGALTFGTDGSVTYPNFDTTTLTDVADHTLRARIVDKGGLVTTADVTFHVDQSTATTGPTISQITFTDGTVLEAPLTFEATVADANGVSKVAWKVTAVPSGSAVAEGPMVQR